MMENLKNLINELKCYRDELGLKKLSDDMILDCSTRIFNSQNILSQSQGQYPKKQFQEKEIKLKNPNAPASQKQIYALKKLGIPNPEELTMLEASQVIKEKMEELPDY